MVSNRKELLSRLDVGNMFHASFSNDAVRICIVTAVKQTTLVARAITTQEIFEFDRVCGRATSREGAVCTIDSVYSLPGDMREVLLAFDRRHGKPGPDGVLLSVIERRALIDAGAMFTANPLPP